MIEYGIVLNNLLICILRRLFGKKRVKFKVKRKKYDLLIESKEYIHDLSADPIFKEDEERRIELWRQDPSIFYR